MIWKRRVERMGARLERKRDFGSVGLWQARGLADVLWMVWGDTEHSREFRVVHGRNLAGPGLRHGVIVVGSEVSGLAFVEGSGYRIAVMDDGETAGIPEPAVPQANIDLVMADRVLLCDGSVMRFDAFPTHIR